MALYFNSVTGKIEDDGQDIQKPGSFSIPGGRGVDPSGSGDIQIPTGGIPAQQRYEQALAKQRQLELEASPEQSPFASVVDLNEMLGRKIEAKQAVQEPVQDVPEKKQVDRSVAQSVPSKAKTVSPAPVDVAELKDAAQEFSGLDAYEKIKKDAEEKYKGRYSDLAVSQLFANLGDVIAGKQVGSQNQVFANLRDEAKADRSQASADYKQKQEMDPNSAESKMAQSLAKQMGFQGDVSKLTAEKWKSFGPVQSKMYEMNNDKQKMQSDAAYKRALLGIDQQKIDVERGKSKGDAAKLNSSEKQVLSLATEGLKASKDMRDALAAGDNTFSIVGDNNYTESMRRYAENYGRLQSGGAINKDEEKRFLQMAPGATDNKEMQQRKLDKMEEMFRNRMNVLGVNPDKMVPDSAAPSQASNVNKPKWAK